MSTVHFGRRRCCGFDRRSGWRRIGEKGSIGATKSVDEWRKRKADVFAGAGIKKAETSARSGMANSKTTMKVDRTAAMSQVVFLERADLVTCRRLIPSSGDRAATTAPRPAIDPESGM